MKTLTITLSLILSTCFTVFAQYDVVKVDFLAPINRVVTGAYEMNLDNKHSVQFEFAYAGIKEDDVKIRGFGFTPEYRTYISKRNAPRGFFVAPFLSYHHLELTKDDQDTNESGETIDVQAKGTLNAIGAGGVIGGQLLIADMITLEFYIGPRYDVGRVDGRTEGYEENDFETDFVNGFGIRAGATVGLAF